MNPAELALQLKEAINSVSPYIEEHTAIVCPKCKKVCCADKHGRYDENDIAYLVALGVNIPDQDPYREETEACRYITENGCSLSRWMRPYRCTLFFCDALIKSLEEGDSKLYRAFDNYFQNLILVRQEFTGEKG
jgi:hypothetical protein